MEGGGCNNNDNSPAHTNATATVGVASNMSPNSSISSRSHYTDNTKNFHRPTICDPVTEVDRFLMMGSPQDQDEHQRRKHLDDTREYCEALSLNPLRVHVETPSLDFLRTEDFDVVKAARRLALYWKLRKLIFGADRWMRPMDQSGSGTLTAEQVAFFRTGYLQVLLDGNVTNTKGPIALIDHSLLPPGVSHFQPHISMYFITATTCPDMQTNGLTFLFAVKSTDRSLLQPQFELAQRLTTALPTKIKQIVVAQAYEYGKDHLLDYMGYQKEKVTEMELGKESPCIKADSSAALLAKLQQVGFAREILPLDFGGTVNMRANFDEWVRRRLTLEEIITAPPIQNSELMARAVRYNKQRQQGQPHSRALVPSTTAAAVAAVAGSHPSHYHCQQSTTITHAAADAAGQPRRRYQKRKLTDTVAQLREQEGRLRQQNIMLRDEMRRLQGSLAQARFLVSLHLNTTENTTAR
eukprot:scaffold4042_cov165-Amphora_coffeaeformis.AAC.8